jgi:hypothetical protein
MLDIKKNMKKCLTVLIALALFIFVPAFAQEINSCMYINSPGTYYLTQDITSSEGRNCLIVDSNDVYIDCQGHWIIGGGSGGSVGILIISDKTNVSAVNCTIVNFQWGISTGRSGYFYMISISGNNIADSRGFNIPYGADWITIRHFTVEKTSIGISAINTNFLDIEYGWFDDNGIGIYLSGISQGTIYHTQFYPGNTRDIKVDSMYGTVNMLIYDNWFYHTNIEVSGSHNLQFTNYVSTHTCKRNILEGCAIGGNFWGDYSRNCVNNDRNSFCDYAYRIPGTNFDDYAPLAAPQPYLCANLETNVIYMQPTDSKTIVWNLNWHSYIIRPDFIVVSAPSGFSVSFDTSSCNFNAESSSCSAKINIATNGVNTGDYNLQVQVASGDCWYRETITVHVTSQACSGSVQLTLNPSSVNPGGTFQAIISGLSNCGGTAYIKDYQGCTFGQTLATCQVSGSGCSVSLTAPSNAGTYRYYACFDMNLDGQYTSGEYDYKDLTVTTGPTSACRPISTPGTFTLNYDVSANQDVCFPIIVSNVVFDCQGHTIYGNGNTYGIFASQDGVTVKNCNIVDFKAPVLIKSGSVVNNNLNGTFSALIVDGSNVEIYNNTLIGKTASIWLNPNASLVNIHDNSIYGYSAFVLVTDNYNVEIRRNKVEVALSKFYSGSPMNYLFYIRNGSKISVEFYDNVVEGKLPRVLYTEDGTTPNVKLSASPPRDGVSITYNMKIGGNFWWGYSDTDSCQDTNFDNFCDQPYEVEYGIKDEYPLAPLSTFYACPLDIANSGFYIHNTDIEKAGEYRIGADITTDQPSCFDIYVEPSPPYAWFTGVGHVNSVVFDCQGHTITYNGRGSVFNVLSSTNFTLKNCKIQVVNPNARMAILYATYTNTAEAPTISLINNEITSYVPALVATAPAECSLPEAPKDLVPEATNDKIKVYIYNNKITSSSTALKIYCALGEITKNNITANKCMQIGNPSYFTGYGLVKAVTVYDNMMMCDVNQPIVVDSSYPDTAYAWNVDPRAGVNILGGGRVGGNFWYNYSLNCNDTNYDGFCDQPFVINNNNKDFYPLSSYFLSINVPPVPTYPMLTPASVFFMLSLGISAGLEYAVRSSGSLPFGIVFGVSFLVMLLIGALTNILPAWVILVFEVAAALLAGYILIRFIGGV